jgi:hypothetical protein
MHEQIREKIDRRSEGSRCNCARRESLHAFFSNRVLASRHYVDDLRWPAINNLLGGAAEFRALNPEAILQSRF